MKYKDIGSTKPWYESNTIRVFTLVLAAGGLDIITTVIEQETISWRSVALACIGLCGIALRVTSSKGIR